MDEGVESLFKDATRGREGTIGAASYEEVLSSLMPVQQENLLRLGRGKSLIVFGVFHSPHAVLSINTRRAGKTDYTAWNIYAREYHELNALLNKTAAAIADHVNGIPIPATLEGAASHIHTVEDYYSMTISQRVGAELAGLGWRGKNELIVTRKGCALRIASVISPKEILSGEKVENQCGTCTACLEVCPFLRKKHILKNYREQCRRFIVTLRLEADVCGKCVRACFEHWSSVEKEGPGGSPDHPKKGG